MDGFDCWDNPYFRNESGQLASEMIREAIAITLWCWGTCNLPLDGFHSFVDTRKVRPTIRRGRPVFGYCFEKAGFTVSPVLTKKRKLLRYIISLEELRAIMPVEPERERQLRLFA